MSVRKKQKNRSSSIKWRIAYAIFALVFLQGLVLVCSITLTGVLSKNDIATYKTLSNQQFSRKNEIQQNFNTKRLNITNFSLDLCAKIDDYMLAEGITVDDLARGGSYHNEVLDLILDDLINFTKYNSVTGVFAVFDPTPQVAEEKVTSRSAMYIRNSSPGIVAENNSNLLLEYGRVDLARQRGVAVDYLWTQEMKFANEFSRDFYFNPVKEAVKSVVKSHRIQVYGYWNAPFMLRSDDISIITYTLPLIMADGTVCGVIGFELDENYVGSLMPSAEVPFDKGFYLLGIDFGEGFFTDNIISSGALATQFLSGSRDKINFDRIYENEKATVGEMSRSAFPDNKSTGAYSEINLYETYSPFYNEKWMLISLAPKESVMSGSVSIKNSILASLGSSLLFALLVSVFVVFYLSSPIHRLSEKVKSINPEKPVRFERTTIREIDELSGAFEVLSDGVSEAAAKMFRIIELVGLPLGSFEIRHEDELVYVSKSLLSVMGIDPPSGNAAVISKQEWLDFLGGLTRESVIEDDDNITETLYQGDRFFGDKRWYRIRQITENMREIGVLLDVTDEIRRKQTVEFERDHDSLTALLNRQAFLDKVARMIAAQPSKVAVMMFADIDDLKYVNDLYGHEAGDNYIKIFAGFLNKFSEHGAAVGRMSGDEFVMFAGGFDSREEARAFFDRLNSELKTLSFSTADGSTRNVKASVGLSYYPENATTVRDLVKFADYAMYEIKHTVKGGMREFDKNTYDDKTAANMG